MRRLFLGLALSAETIAQLDGLLGRLKAIDGLARSHPRWIPLENLHLTLKFLGATPDEVIDPLWARVSEAFVEPFELTCRGLGAFPKLSMARILWAGVEERSGALRRLAAELEAVAEPFGFARETREFHPHITLAKMKGGVRLPSLPEVGALGVTRVNEMILYESVAGGHYAVMKRCRKMPNAGCGVFHIRPP